MINAYINGQFVSEAKISPFDLGFLRGYSTFEHFRTYNQKPDLLKRHLDRLRRSASELMISISLTDTEIESIIMRILDRNGFKESTIRIILSKGLTENGLTPIGESSLIILTRALSLPPQSIYDEGMQAITTMNSRSFPHIKTLNYLPGLLALEKAKSSGAKEAIYCSQDGKLLEGTTSNFFGIKEGQLYTAREGILLGITRATVLNIAKEILPITLDSIHINELPLLDEAFTTSSIKGIVPIVKINGKVIGDGKPGSYTKTITRLFRARFFELAFD